MKIQESVPLLPFNTFGLPARAPNFAEIHSLQDLREALRSGIRPVFVLGGGSNVLFTRDPEGLVLKNSIRGIEVVRRFKNRIWVRIGGGEVWHNFVLWAVQNGYGGVENLSLIPGTAGAAPVQNIGAYGVELKDVFVGLQAVDLATGRLRHFSRKDCRFGYRDSFFKKEGKGKYCITSVTLSLTIQKHRINVSYGDILKILEAEGINQPGIADVSRAIIQIRSSKLPDPAKTGNCGSFFKNPETDRTVLERIRLTHPNVPSYELPGGRVKIPAGWLIEQCGWKGKRVGNTGCYEKQALVLVNHGGATGEEVKNLAFAIIGSVEQTFGVRLEPEVNIL
ncbi:MAG: UDP-N-acetylmuramate dehydrogenase [Haliscomenobacteraceae bacterium CHB4]|nr:UDP-N-acetylenolpyruvoylglucosamine reductase [Saprospiraceae bacterium]MCE7924402.1 UDP-N-acetylmuramate dehydrogenase [Haliscomenobacteraceae bacterium CHB4]